MLLNAYNRELERRRLAAGAQGLLIFGDGVLILPVASLPSLPDVQERKRSTMMIQTRSSITLALPRRRRSIHRRSGPPLRTTSTGHLRQVAVRLI